MPTLTLNRQVREAHTNCLLAAHRARLRPTPYDDVKHPLGAIVHGLVHGIDHRLGWTFVQWIDGALFGPISFSVSHLRLKDRGIVSMDVLECLRERGYVRREGDLPKEGNEAGANQVYISARPTTPISHPEPNELPIAHSFVLDAFETERHLDEAKLIRILSGATVISPARGMNAYHRIAGAILKDLERHRLVARTSGGWYVAPSL